MKKIFMGLLVLSVSTHGFANYLSNYNEPNATKLIEAMRRHSFHVVQLGDSHTAGDSMTGTLRDELQSRYGNGGMGWSMPMYFSGQRLLKFGYDKQDWTPISSRRNHQEDYTIGGLLAKPNGMGSQLTIKSRQDQPEQHIVVSIKQGDGDGFFSGIDAYGRSFLLEAPVKNGTWQTAHIQAKLPFTITAQGVMSDSYLGGWWAFEPNRAGALVSALGINGAELAHWNRWNDLAWQNELKDVAPDLIILAYGTNEAYNDREPKVVQQVLQEKVRSIRQAVPSAAVMIVSSPETLKSTSGQCGTRPSGLTQIQQAQKDVAMSEQTLFWDWQQAMGGECSMATWMRDGKAAKDGVHFTHAGYAQLGKQLANDLIEFTY
ncbi:GDSL-type esterase/lipase family protein [Moraxella sp. Pampa]|uniref:GDSL-type esterase/lipase family protein n=1 Tax=Moraxella sp. Pampa TaxID=3111978 RepID=UPI002B411CB6|nr:GDSL-type esterase/lipase family protein [Moraxella sp. Pampa]